MKLTRDARVIFLLAAFPVLYWTGGPETATSLKRAGIEELSAPPARVTVWKQAGFTVTPLTDEALKGRIQLIAPGIDRKVNVASATTAPWVNANGWQIRRAPGREFWYDLPAGTAILAAAEAYAYGAKAALKIDPRDLDALGKMLTFLRSIPDRELPDVADFGFVDNGTDSAAEILNLMNRRNLLFRIVQAPDPRLALNVAANDDDPHLFAAKVRERLTDEKRSLRVYGSEVVLCRMTAGEGSVRIHVLNYGRRGVEGVRLRVRGIYASGKIYAPESMESLGDFAAADGFTEFSIPVLGSYAVIDLTR